MGVQETDKRRFLIGASLGGVVIVSYLLLKAIMWMDGAK